MRIKIGKNKYLAWNRKLVVGESAPNEDLWDAGYRASCVKILGIKLILFNKG